MASAPLPELADGTRVFLDSNILVYGLLGRSQQCRDLLTRCTKGEVEAVVSLSVIEEATHKLMLAEARATGSIREERAVLLVDKPEIVKSLKSYWHNLTIFLHFGVQTVAAETADLSPAHILRERYGLMTRDSMLGAIMLRHEIVNLATGDRHLAGIDEFSAYLPTDL